MKYSFTAATLACAVLVAGAPVDSFKRAEQYGGASTYGSASATTPDLPSITSYSGHHSSSDMGGLAGGLSGGLGGLGGSGSASGEGEGEGGLLGGLLGGGAGLRGHGGLHGAGVALPTGVVPPLPVGTGSLLQPPRPASSATSGGEYGGDGYGSREHAKRQDLSSLSGLSGLGGSSSGLSGLSGLSGTSTSGLNGLSGLSGLGSLSTGAPDLSSLGGSSGLSGLSALGGSSGLPGLASLGGGSSSLPDLSSLSGGEGLSGLSSLGGGSSGLSSLSGLGGGSLRKRQLGSSSGLSGLSSLGGSSSGLSGLSSLGSGSSGLSGLASLGSLFGSTGATGTTSLTGSSTGTASTGTAALPAASSAQSSGAASGLGSLGSLGSLLGGSSGGSSNSPNDVTDNTGCKDMTLVFARGTGEPGTLGYVVGPGLESGLKSALGSHTLAVQGVDYPADAAGNANLGASGGPTMAKLAQQALSQCPQTKLVLGGYSQGGMVVHNACGSFDCSKAAAVVAFGDPFNGQAFKGVPADKTIEVCGQSDAICASGPSNVQGSHLDYGSDTAAAAQKVVAAAGL
ncbi:hypothetical protein H2203_008321 [Taxawa tesnikishii (nom. ined.)]|nr:hypothetical protein H2203_008321 [Dothideales sp. JES 119]